MLRWLTDPIHLPPWKVALLSLPAMGFMFMAGALTVSCG